VITFLVMEVFLCIVALAALFRGKIKVIKVYTVIGLFFLIIANVSASESVSTHLNANRYITTDNFRFNLNDHYLGMDSARGLMAVYNNSHDAVRREQVRNRLERIHRRYVDEPWQNRSIIKRINIRHVERFLNG